MSLIDTVNLSGVELKFKKTSKFRMTIEGDICAAEILVRCGKNEYELYLTERNCQECKMFICRRKTTKNIDKLICPVRFNDDTPVKAIRIILGEKTYVVDHFKRNTVDREDEHKYTKYCFRRKIEMDLETTSNRLIALRMSDTEYDEQERLEKYIKQLKQDLEQY